ncbi:hypothetical protein BH09SUM1_BH09SUM1_31420 [soil metagenome]
MKRMIHAAAAVLLLASAAYAAPNATAGDIAAAEKIRDASKSQLDAAVAKVKPALVRIKVVDPEYYDGREEKSIAFGSGTIISPDGYIMTNHHVAGKAMRLMVTMVDRTQIPAVLIGTDPATDIAIIKLTPPEATTFPFATFGNSDEVRVGDAVMALGSPEAISQSVTLGIMSNTEMITPESFGDYTFTLDGESVGELVRWFGHDAAIFPGNSGGPLVNMSGEIIGVNEIGLGLGGAIPGNLAKSVAEQLIKDKKVDRAYFGVSIQPLLRHVGQKDGVLVNTVLKDSPAMKAGVKAGDLLLSVNGAKLEGRFGEDLPGINGVLAGLPIGKEASIVVLRDDKEQTISTTPELRQPACIPETELKQWGITARDVSVWKALEIARDSKSGVVVTSLRPGGPAAKARPELRGDDIITMVNDQKISNVKDLQDVTKKITEGKKGFVPALVQFEREAETLITVVEVGIDELQSPGREVVKGWLPLETQVMTRELAKQLGTPDLKGVRVTRLYSVKPADFPFKVGDIVTHVNGEELEASRKEDADVWETTVRGIRPGTETEFDLIRGTEKMKVKATTSPSPAKSREMKRYKDDEFEFIVREAAFADREKPTLVGQEFNVLADSVTSGGWASLANLKIGDAILQIDGKPIKSVSDVEATMKEVKEKKATTVVFFVRRDAQSIFLEMEPSW